MINHVDWELTRMNWVKVRRLELPQVFWMNESLWLDAAWISSKFVDLVFFCMIFFEQVGPTFEEELRWLLVLHLILNFHPPGAQGHYSGHGFVRSLSPWWRFRLNHFTSQVVWIWSLSSESAQRIIEDKIVVVMSNHLMKIRIEIWIREMNSCCPLPAFFDELEVIMRVHLWFLLNPKMDSKGILIVFKEPWLVVAPKIGLGVGWPLGHWSFVGFKQW